jgi:hypothetical protein
MGLLSYIQSLDRWSQLRLQILEFDRHQKLVGFGYRMRQTMCSISHHLRKMHMSFTYSSDLLNRVFIQLPYFRVSFPHEPISTVLLNDPVTHLTWGIANDTYQFRSMVSLLLRSTPELINMCQPLPAHLTPGIANDTYQFHSMVSLLLRPMPKLINLCQPLPIDFQLFFLKIFTHKLYLGNFQKFKEYSYYMLYHPITHIW